MDYVKAFLIGGLLCLIGQILIDKTKLTPARILVSYVVIGVLLGAVGVYQPLAEFAGAGASVPLTGFGNTLAKGVKEAVQKADPALLEPMMSVEVVVPDEYMGDVIGDLNSRRGRVVGTNAHAGLQSIDGLVPLSEMFGYATDLRSRTQGRGTYTMQFAHYEEVPKSIASKVLGI